MKKAVLSLALLLPLVAMAAPPKAVAEIRQQYAKNKECIVSLHEIARRLNQESDAGYGGCMFVIHIRDNAMSASAPGIGAYYRELWFYYELDEENNAALNMIAESFVVAHNEPRIYQEFMYDKNGKVSFVYKKRMDGEEKTEKRIYFDKGRPVFYSEDNAEIKPNEAYREMAAQGKKQAEEFKRVFEAVSCYQVDCFRSEQGMKKPAGAG